MVVDPPPAPPDLTLLYVGNNTSNDISAYSFDTAGKLTPVAGSPFAAGCQQPNGMAVTPSKKFLYVACPWGTVVSGFSINLKTGALTPLSPATYTTGFNPEALAIDPGGKFLFVANGGDTDVAAFTIDANSGALAPVMGSPFAVNLWPNGLAIDPLGKYLYVSTSYGFDGDLEGFAIGPSGALSPLPGSPFAAVSGMGGAYIPDSVQAHPSGKFVFAGRGTPDIVTYGLNATTGALAQSSITTALHGTPNAMAHDPGGKFLYSVNWNGNQISGFAINATTGALTEVPNSPYTLSGVAEGMTVEATGKFLFVGTNDNKVNVFAIDGTTGALTVAAGAPYATGTRPAPMVTVP